MMLTKITGRTLRAGRVLAQMTQEQVAVRAGAHKLRGKARRKAFRRWLRARGNRDVPRSDFVINQHLGPVLLGASLPWGPRASLATCLARLVAGPRARPKCGRRPNENLTASANMMQWWHARQERRRQWRQWRDENKGVSNPQFRKMVEAGSTWYQTPGKQQWGARSYGAVSII
jgi:hypothetical protein